MSEILGDLINLINKKIDNQYLRALVFQLYENNGVVKRDKINHVIKLISSEERKKLWGMGIKIGRYHIYLPKMLKPKAVILRIALWKLYFNLSSKYEIPQFGLNFLNNKNTPFILVQLVDNTNKSDLFSVFESFKLNGSLDQTCLTPVLKTLNLEGQNLLLPDLLILLREKNKIRNVACFNQQGNQVGIVKYSKEDIIKRIYDIKNIQR